jgi:hypothetical protein
LTRDQSVTVWERFGGDDRIDIYPNGTGDIWSESNLAYSAKELRAIAEAILKELDSEKPE